MGIARSQHRSSFTTKELDESMDFPSECGMRHSRHSETGDGFRQNDEVIFHVGQETVMRISARKSVLSKRNEVFHAMFCGPYTVARENLRCRQETTNNGIVSSQLTTKSEDQIYEPDLDGRAFKNLISFLYGEAVELRSVTTALETLHAAEKYLCDGLMKICVSYLTDQLSAENVLYVYQRIRVYPHAGNGQNVSTSDDKPSAPTLEELNPHHIGSQLNQNLQTKSRTSWCSFLLNSCLEFIDKNASVVLCSEEFEELDAETVESIVRRDGLHVKNESQILSALISWSIFECHRRRLDPNTSNQRLVLDHLLWHVRFSAMSVQESQQVSTILESLAPGEFPALRTIQSQVMVDSANHNFNSRLPYIVTKPRKYLASKVDTVLPTSDTNRSNLNSCEKVCLAERLFVCLACIFE